MKEKSDLTSAEEERTGDMEKARGSILKFGLPSVYNRVYARLLTTCQVYVQYFSGGQGRNVDKLLPIITENFSAIQVSEEKNKDKDRENTALQWR